MRRRMDSKLEGNTAGIMPVQGQAADEAVGKARVGNNFLRQVHATLGPALYAH